MFGDVDYDPSCTYPVSRLLEAWAHVGTCIAVAPSRAHVLCGSANPRACALRQRQPARTRTPPHATASLASRRPPHGSAAHLLAPAWSHTPLWLQSVPLEEQLGALGRAVEAGKVRRRNRARSISSSYHIIHIISDQMGPAEIASGQLLLF